MGLNRRDWLRASGLGLLGASASRWFPAFAAQPNATSAKRRHCILLWMNGGPSQLDTFDMKPGHENGGEFREIATSVPGLGISEHLPRLAGQAHHLAIIRSLATTEGDHGRGAFLMRTGQKPISAIRYPTLGSALSKELGDSDGELPNYVSISPYPLFNRQAYSAGFLGPRYAPLTVGSSNNAPPAAGVRYSELGVDDLAGPPEVDAAQAEARLAMWRTLQQNFVRRHQSASPQAHDTVYQRAVRMMRSETVGAFDLSQEPAAVRDSYGRGRFGQGCLLARRLVEHGVPFVEVSLGSFNGDVGWDTHANNFAAVRALSAELDAGWASLVSDLADRGLLESTTILWMGEFGRTPKINNVGGRDHFPNAWTCVLAGGGLHGGQAYGRTSADGMEIQDGKVSVGNVLATLCTALEIDPATQNISEAGRPIALAEGPPIAALLR